MNHAEFTTEYKALAVTSGAFSENETIPVKYTCKGADINPPIDIGNIPEEAHSLALVVDDPDAPGKTWVHWVVWNIPITHHIKENSIPGVQGINDFKKSVWGGPCPPGGTHRYFFKVYALDTLLELQPGSDKQQLERAMDGHIVAFGSLMGLFSK
jgi:Raf kinase inhibitor-like YbhB/YbcL family protein